MHTRPLTTTETATRLGKSRETTRRLVASGRLHGEKVENRWLVEESSIAALERERQPAAPQPLFIAPAEPEPREAGKA
jgi:excisionase family DNA binding protein